MGNTTSIRLDSDDLFIESRNGSTMTVSKTDKLHKATLDEGDWTCERTVDSYSECKLEVLNSVIKGQELKQLLAKLGRYSWAVNRRGYIYSYAFYPFGSFTYFRLNDLFDWSRYGVEVTTVSNMWHRLEMNSNKVVVGLLEKDKRIEEYEEKLEEKEKDLCSSREKLEEVEKELSIVQKNLEEKETQIARLLEDKEKETLALKKLLEINEEELSICKGNLEQTKELDNKMTALSSTMKYLEECLLKQKEKEWYVTTKLLSVYQTRLDQKNTELNNKEKEVCLAKSSLDGRLKELKDHRIRLENLEKAAMGHANILEQKDEELNFMKKELSKTKKRSEEKDQDLKEMNKKQTDNSVSLTHLEQLSAQADRSRDCCEDSTRRGKEPRMSKTHLKKNEQKEERKIELSSCQKSCGESLPEQRLKETDFDIIKKLFSVYEIWLSQKDLELNNKEKYHKLKEMAGRLQIEQMRVEAFKAALKCLVTFLHDLQLCHVKKLDYSILLPSIRNEEDVALLEKLNQPGITVAEISATILKVVEKQNYTQE